MGLKPVKLQNPHDTPMTAAVYKHKSHHQYELIHIEWVGPRSSKKFMVENRPLKMHIYRCIMDQHNIPEIRTFNHKTTVDEMIAINNGLDRKRKKDYYYHQ